MSEPSVPVDPAPPELPTTASPVSASSPAATALPLPADSDTPADLVRAMQQAMAAPPPSAAIPPALEAPRISHPFVFHGDTREYFRIWIVNTLLTLLTLGIYSAWAKVRKRRYLRGSTELMGHRFDYRADPRRILVGNVLVAVVFIGYAVFGQVYPAVRLGAIVIALILLPWVIVRSVSFNAHNTVYRGLRFNFRQSYGWTALVYLGQCFFILLTVGLYYPAWIRNRKRFVIGSHRLGDAFFHFESKSGPFYAAYLISGCLLLGAGLLGALVTGIIVAANGAKVPTGIFHLLPFVVIYGLTAFFSKHYVYARLFNHIWNHTRLDEHRFVADLPLGRWLRLQAVNLCAIVGTCGLMYPWAVVRSTRLALAHLRFEPRGPVETIARLGRNRGSAVGDTAAEFAGIDLAL